MNMTGFERLMRTLRGLATAYDICIEIDPRYMTGMVVLKYGNDINDNNINFKKDIPPVCMKDEIAFEEFLKQTCSEFKEIMIYDHSNKSECTDMSGMQGNDAQEKV